MRDMPINAINSRSEYVVFSHRLGLIAEDSTASDAVRRLIDHMRRFPASDAAIYKQSDDIWRIF